MLTMLKSSNHAAFKCYKLICEFCEKKFQKKLHLNFERRFEDETFSRGKFIKRI